MLSVDYFTPLSDFRKSLQERLHLLRYFVARTSNVTHSIWNEWTLSMSSSCVRMWEHIHEPFIESLRLSLKGISSTKRNLPETKVYKSWHSPLYFHEQFQNLLFYTYSLHSLSFEPIMKLAYIFSLSRSKEFVS